MAISTKSFASFGITIALAMSISAPTFAFANATPTAEGESAAASTTTSAQSAPAAASNESSSATTADETHAGSFSFAGTGNTVDSVKESDSLKFYTIKSPDNNVFYLVVDEQATTDNVYLLNEVNEADLAALTKSGTSGFTSNLTATPSAETSAATEQSSQQVEQAKEETPQVPTGLVWLVIILLAGGGAFAYYKIKLEPERKERKVEEERVREFMEPAANDPANTVPIDTDSNPLNN